MPPSEDEASLDDDEFVVPSDPAEQERFKRRLLATASNLKKKQQQLRAAQDLLADRWTEVLAAEEYELERPCKSYPKRSPLPRLEEEAPTSPAHDMADRPPRGRDREACRPSTQALPRRCSTKARENVLDLRSTGRAGALRHVTMIFTLDTTNPAGPNTTDTAVPSCIVI